MNKKGFTLIELLIVMAILGVLAVVVLVAINPIQQLARTRDTGRKSSVTQIGHALQAYYTSRGGTYPTQGNTWITALTAAGEIGSIPGLIAYSVSGVTQCANGANTQNSICYDYTSTSENAIIWTALESNSERAKCTGAGEYPYFVFNAQEGRGGLVCDTDGDIAPGVTTTWNANQ